MTVPAAPTEADILASLARVEAMLADGTAPSVVRSRVARIDRTIRETLPKLPQLGWGSADAYAVVATATDYLPEAVGGYLRLPRDWANSRPIEGGRTALMVLVDQLELLASTMTKMLDAANRADAEALIAHGRFLEAKFGHVLVGRHPRRRAGAPPAAAAAALDPGPGVMRCRLRLSSLAAALAALGEAAAAAGVDPDVARAEGEAIAATVAEAATGAYLDWSAQTGGDRSAEEFFDAASRGRRFRSGPTPYAGGAGAGPPPRGAGLRDGAERGLHRRRDAGHPDAAGDGQRLDRRGGPAGRRTSLAAAGAGRPATCRRCRARPGSG